MPLDTDDYSSNTDTNSSNDKSKNNGKQTGTKQPSDKPNSSSVDKSKKKNNLLTEVQPKNKQTDKTEAENSVAKTNKTRSDSHANDSSKNTKDDSAVALNKRNTTKPLPPKKDSNKNETSKRKEKSNKFSMPENDSFVNTENKNDDQTDPRIFSEFPSTEPNETKDVKTSRSVKISVGQKLEAVYPGEGWIYLGETTSQRGIKYRQRKLQDGLSIFNFDAESTGDYILNFSYFDVFSDEFISDALAVKVEPPKYGLTGTVHAPDYKGSTSRNMAKVTSPKKDAKSDNTNSVSKPKDEPKSSKNNVDNFSDITSSVNKEEKNKAVSDLPTLAAIPEKELSNSQNKSKLDVNDALQRARDLIAKAKAKEAISLLDDFLQTSTTRLDEGWFLRGQAYELNGKEKNIKQALSSYRTVTDAYPESAFWDKADIRIRYIEKFYMNID